MIHFLFTESTKPEETLPAQTEPAESTTAEPAAPRAAAPGQEQPEEASTGAAGGASVLPESSAVGESPPVVVVPTVDGQVVELLGEIVDILRETEETTREETEEVPPPYTQPLETMQLELGVIVFGVAMCFGAALAKFFWKGADHGS